MRHKAPPMFSRLFQSRGADSAAAAGSVHFVGATDLGRRRKNNEDAFGAVRLDGGSGLLQSGCWAGASATCGLLVSVSDGMGGANGGEVASNLAIELIGMELQRIDVSRNVAPAALAVAALHRVHAAIFAKAEAAPGLRGMGAALCALWFQPGALDALLLNVGDSRAYRWRRRSMEQLSRDQTMAQGMIERGEMTAEQVVKTRVGGLLEHALGADGRPIEPQVVPVALESGDLYLLCTDGLHGALDAGAISRLLPAKPDHRDLPRIAQRLVESARDASGADNITAMVSLIC